MKDWFKNITKPYPEFWKNYLSKFSDKSKRYVSLSLGKTIDKSNTDRITSIVAIVIEKDSIIINDCIELFIKQDHKNSKKKYFINEALEILIDFIGNATLVGYHINSDIELLDLELAHMNCGNLKNEAIDIELMYNKFKIKNNNPFIENLISSFKSNSSELNTPSDKTYLAALLFLKLKAGLKFT